MEASIKCVVLIFMVAAASSIGCVASWRASVSSTTCPPQSNTFIYDLLFQCPPTIAVSSPVEMDGDSLDEALSSGQTKARTAVLFYASWCPFSAGVHTKFVALSSMFPQIEHIMVEQSRVMPSVFSRYGIHSIPSILMINSTARMRYRGPKDLLSLVQFYRRTTGLEPALYLTEEQNSCAENAVKSPDTSRGNSMKQTFMEEPYLIFSVLFLLVRLFLHFFPDIVSHLNALWITYMPHPNVGIFGESRQILALVLYLIDLKRVWSKLKVSKTRNFHDGARSARVWASSLASVSLGETTSSRLSAPGTY